MGEVKRVQRDRAGHRTVNKTLGEFVEDKKIKQTVIDLGNYRASCKPVSQNHWLLFRERRYLLPGLRKQNKPNMLMGVYLIILWELNIGIKNESIEIK